MPQPRRHLHVVSAIAVLAACLIAVGHGATGRLAARLVGARQVGAQVCGADRAAGHVEFVSPFGYDASAGIIDVLVAERLGYFATQCLDVGFVAGAPDPAALVSSGKAAFTGEGSAADLLAADAAGASLVGVATFGNTSDYALLTSPSITDLRQLEGHTLGYHPPLPVILREMLQRAAVQVSKVHLVIDGSYNPLLLVEGRFQALQAYQSNEPLVLEAAHKSFREWTPAQFGVAGTFNVQAVGASFLRAHPVAVAAFLRAELHAFDYCLTHSQSCIAIEQQAAGGAAAYDSAHELAVWRFESRLATSHRLAGRGVGVESYAEWRPEAAALAAFHLVGSPPDLNADEDPAIAASLYHATSLVWPG